jgi:phosphatidylserine/phosphatidylglycerophosphate/cardiolipin synthase-like enzyme
MKKRPSLLLPSASKKYVISALTALIFSFFAWLSHTSVTPSTPLPQEEAQIFATERQDDLRLLFRSAIESAQSSIFMAVYTLTDPAIINALKNKAQEGIHVEVVVDAKASPHAAKNLGPKVKTIRRLGPGIMHCKILVVDKQLVWMGSANMTADSLQMHSNLVLGVQNNELAGYILDKSETFVEIGATDSIAHRQFNIGGQSVEFWFLPDEGKNALRRLKELIRSAKKTIHVAMFTWTRYDLAHEVVKAAKRGVSVQVVIDKNSGKGASAQVVKLLKSNSIDVRLSRGMGLLHHKFMVVDGKTLVNGSANWTKAAFNSNDDCFMLIDPLSEQQNRTLEEEWTILYSDSQAA